VAAAGATPLLNAGINPAGAATGNGALDLVKKQLGILSANAGKGTTLRAGYIGPLSGPGQPYSVDQMAGLKTAAKVIKLLGGPTIDITFLDNQSGSAQAGITAVRQLRSSGIDLLFSSYIGDFGALFEPVKNAKMFALDAGGTYPIAWSQPYFWNTALDWSQAYPGEFYFLRKKYPNAKTVAIVTGDLGPILNAATVKFATAAASAKGFDLSNWTLIPQGSTDFSTGMTAIQQTKPDLVWVPAGANTVGTFMTQYAQAGLSYPVTCGALNPVDVQTGGSAMNGMTSTSAYFFPKHPANPLGELLSQHYVGQETTLRPNWNAAFFFQAAINMWELSTLCRKAHEKVTGPNMNAQMEKSPFLHTPFGGSPTKVQTVRYNKSTHIITSGTVNNCVIQNGHFYLAATNNLTGTDYVPEKTLLRVT
jgi:ABC-type branched-subunit amino acid transport system substrate-binding protein